MLPARKAEYGPCPCDNTKRGFIYNNNVRCLAFTNIEVKEDTDKLEFNHKIISTINLQPENDRMAWGLVASIIITKTKTPHLPKMADVIKEITARAINEISDVKEAEKFENTVEKKVMETLRKLFPEKAIPNPRDSNELEDGDELEQNHEVARGDQTLRTQPPRKSPEFTIQRLNNIHDTITGWTETNTTMRPTFTTTQRISAPTRRTTTTIPDLEVVISNLPTVSETPKVRRQGRVHFW
uniref:Uncharacterized protein n=1 Tax=Strongyloides papillosus TaxID=174720 RepID=A0A0N5BH09_STREA